MYHKREDQNPPPLERVMGVGRQQQCSEEYIQYQFGLNIVDIPVRTSLTWADHSLFIYCLYLVSHVYTNTLVNKTNTDQADPEQFTGIIRPTSIII